MVDLETLAVGVDAHIATIGAIAFNSWGKIIDEFYRRVEFRSCEELGLKTNEATLQFWQGQNDEAKKEVFDSENRIPIQKVLSEFADFWKKNKGEKFWCNGANFDEPILSNAFDRAGMEKPWKFWNVRCLRTYMSIVGLSMSHFGFVSHHALEDCKNQIVAYKKVTEQLGKFK